MLLAIDPGSEQSGCVVYGVEENVILESGIVDNLQMLDDLALSMMIDTLVIEYPVVRGQMMKSQVIETIFWIGRFAQVWGDMGTFIRFDRREVALRLCGRAAAKDKQIRRALIERFPKTGGGKEPSIGTKVSPGPLYGIKTHCWAALGVAVAYTDRLKEVEHAKMFDK